MQCGAFHSTPTFTFVPLLLGALAPAWPHVGFPAVQQLCFQHCQPIFTVSSILGKRTEERERGLENVKEGIVWGYCWIWALVMSHTLPLKKWSHMQHFSLVSTRNGVLCTYLLLVVQSELVSPGSSRGCWSMVAVVPNLYKQHQGEERRDTPQMCWEGFSSEQLMQGNAVWERLQHVGVGMWWQVGPVLAVFRAPFPLFTSRDK